MKHCVPQCQIVGMSATLPNMIDLSNWLDASLFTTTYRPVHLSVRVCADRNLYEIKPDLKNDENMTFTLDRHLPSLEDFLKAELSQGNSSQLSKPAEMLDSIVDDTEGFLSLVLETLILNKAVMVFCNSKRRCELCVDRIAKMIYSINSVENLKHTIGIHHQLQLKIDTLLTSQIERVLHFC